MKSLQDTFPKKKKTFLNDTVNKKKITKVKKNIYKVISEITVFEAANTGP